MIAATAVAHGLALSTCNPDDFAAIDELEVVAVPHPDHAERARTEARSCGSPAVTLAR